MQLSRNDIALAIASLAPLAIVGLLVLIGFGIEAAACITFVLVFVITSTMDLRWLLQRRKSQS